MSGVSVLQNELKGGSDKIALVVFDLLYLNGRDIRNEPLFRRKAELKKIVAGTDVQFSESFDIDPKDMLAHACKVGLEGVVSKVRDSAYASGRINNWVKYRTGGACHFAHADLPFRGRSGGDLNRRTASAKGARAGISSCVCTDTRGQTAAFEPRLIA